MFRVAAVPLHGRTWETPFVLQESGVYFQSQRVPESRGPSPKPKTRNQKNMLSTCVWDWEDIKPVDGWIA